MVDRRGPRALRGGGRRHGGAGRGDRRRGGAGARLAPRASAALHRRHLGAGRGPCRAAAVSGLPVREGRAVHLSRPGPARRLRDARPQPPPAGSAPLRRGARGLADRDAGRIQRPRRAPGGSRRGLGAPPGPGPRCRGQDRGDRHPRPALGDLPRRQPQRRAGPLAFLGHRALRRARQGRHEPHRSRDSRDHAGGRRRHAQRLRAGVRQDGAGLGMPPKRSGEADGDASPADMARSFSFERLPPDFHDDPYPYHAALREHDPVHRLDAGKILVSRYADVERIYKDPKVFSSDKTIEFGAKFGPSPLYEHHTTSLVFNDPPLHSRVRRLIAGALNPRAIASMEDGVVALVDGLLDCMAGRDEADLVDDYAAAIPVEVIGNLLDVPRDERGPLRAWSLAILGALEPVVTPERLSAGNRALVEFLAYLERLVVAKRRKSSGDPDKDILTRLIAGESSGERLSEAELLQNCIF